MFLALCAVLAVPGNQPSPVRFAPAQPAEVRAWQRRTRAWLFARLMGGKQPRRVPLDARVLQRREVPEGGFVLEEITLQSLPDRRLHAWVSRPRRSSRKVGAVLALHGHGGTGEQVVRGEGLYWYGRALAEMGYVVIAPDIGSHELQHAGWTLMGERTWDAIRCMDYVSSLPEVDPDRVAVCGLSLGGETTMYVAGLDERAKAVNSSGWLTTVANMRNGHCPCFDFPGLGTEIDFSDIFALVAPRPLVCEIGRQERALGGFPVEIARTAFDRLRVAYSCTGALDRLWLDVHAGGHVFVGREFWKPLSETLGSPFPWGSSVSALADAERRGEIGRRAFSRAAGVVQCWLRRRDTVSGLFPRTLDQPVWAPNDNAADMLPFLWITAHALSLPTLKDVENAFRAEQRLTNRPGPLPDWYDLGRRSFVHEVPDLKRVTFGAAEYCKDGLVPMLETMGQGPWVARMEELLNAIFERASVPSDHGLLPASDAEVNGDLVQALCRMHALTGERRYLEWAERIGDAYCREVLPRNGGLPAHDWDFANHRPRNVALNMNDHGNEIIGGLAELLMAIRHRDPDRFERYAPAITAMAHRLLAHGRNRDGIWFGALDSTTAQPTLLEPPDTWGYALSAITTIGMATGDGALLAAARTALRNIDQPPYLQWQGADAYADCIEGALLLLNRFEEPLARRWLDRVLPLFLGKQRHDGIVEGWYGDGNYARTAMMVGLWASQGCMPRPWRPDVRIGAVRAGNRLLVRVSADQVWDGSIAFDAPRHREVLNLPVNYPRLNEFPEWFTVSGGRRYRVESNGTVQVLEGSALRKGLPVRIGPGQSATIAMTPLDGPAD